MDRLWSPWRLAYVTASDKTTGCIFCAALESLEPGVSVPDADAVPRAELVVFRGRACYVILNLYPYNNGHLMVVPNRHIGSLADAAPDERAELMELTRLSEMALRQAYSPHGLNVGLNLGKAAGAGVLDHLHLHVVPRWSGDTNFMTVVGEARVLPERLADTAARLRPIFSALATDA